jgi:hypothetical protein
MAEITAGASLEYQSSADAGQFFIGERNGTLTVIVPPARWRDLWGLLVVSAVVTVPAAAPLLSMNSRDPFPYLLLVLLLLLPGLISFRFVYYLTKRRIRIEMDEAQVRWHNDGPFHRREDHWYLFSVDEFFLLETHGLYRVCIRTHGSLVTFLVEEGRRETAAIAFALQKAIQRRRGKAEEVTVRLFSGPVPTVWNS